MKWWQKGCLGLGCLVCLAAAPIVALLFVRGTGKSEAPHIESSPASAPVGAVTPELQLESHTCGLLSLRAAYAAYGLEPDEENLRFRLGTDVEALPGDQTSTGTLQPDLLRVLVQDRFGYRLVGPEAIGAIGEVADHLIDGQLALLLISRRENGNLHWVVGSELRGDHLEVIDSLFPEPYLEMFDEFFREHVVTALLIRPCDEGCPSLTTAHIDGTRDMVRCKKRWEELRALAGLAE